ncbi:MAG: winged helix-turn-helix transcriptional regulator [Candidatus Hodarchaeota archaeon]
MDEKDFEILKILDKNCRISYSKIAERLKSPVRNISNRIDNLINENVIERFTVQFNYNSLGFRHYIGSASPPKGKTSLNLFQELQLISEIYRIWELIDGSITISFFCRDAKHLEEVINNILNTGAELHSYTETRVHFTLDIPYSINDWQIIFYLLNNSRASKKEIAQVLNISEKTVNRRINRMVNMKLVSFIPEINFEAISGVIPAVIFLETVGPSKQVYLRIKEDQSIKYWRNAGAVSPSIVLFVYGKNLTEIYNIYQKLKKKKDIKEASLTFIVRNAENSTLIEDAVLEKIQNG